MNTETLIKHLSRECRPVTPVGPPLTRFLKWVAAAALFLFLGVLALGSAPSAMGAFGDLSILFTAIAMLFVSLICALSAFVLTIPNNRNSQFAWIPLSAVALCGGLIAVTLTQTDLEESGPGLVCVLRLVGLSIAPAALMFYMLKKAAPMKAGTIGLLAAFAALAFAEVGVQFVCHKAFATHVIVWHFTPVIVLGLTGSLIGRALFRWAQTR
jgi:hypothetical protein